MKGKILIIVSSFALLIALTTDIFADIYTEYPADLANVCSWTFIGPLEAGMSERSSWVNIGSDSGLETFACVGDGNQCNTLSACTGNYPVIYTNTSNPLGCYNELYNVLSNDYPAHLSPWYGFTNIILPDYPSTPIPTETPYMEIKILKFENVYE